MELTTLLDKNRKDLYEIAQERKVSGRGSMSRDELILHLADPPPTKGERKIVLMDSGEVYELAREKDIKGRSSMSMADLQKRLLPERSAFATNGSSDEQGAYVYHVHYGGEHVGYCWPKHLPSVVTSLFWTKGKTKNLHSSTHQKYLGYILEDVPAGCQAKEPPR